MVKHLELLTVLLLKCGLVKSFSSWFLLWKKLNGTIAQLARAHLGETSSKSSIMLT